MRANPDIGLLALDNNDWGYFQGWFQKVYWYVNFGETSNYMEEQFIVLQNPINGLTEGKSFLIDTTNKRGKYEQNLHT